MECRDQWISRHAAGEYLYIVVCQQCGVSSKAHLQPAVGVRSCNGTLETASWLGKVLKQLCNRLRGSKIL